MIKVLALLFLFGILGAWLFIMGVGIYVTYKHRLDGQFKIVQKSENAFTVYYHYDGKWIIDSTHPTEEECMARIRRVNPGSPL